jgi:hypothetical protein
MDWIESFYQQMRLEFARDLAIRVTVSLFAEHVQQLLDAAQSASSRGETCTEMTILIGQDNGISMIAASDSPLESLALDRGARAAYRISDLNGSIRVEGREGSRHCVMEAMSPARTARMLLGA